MVRTQISLTTAQHEGLTKLAGEQSISMSALVRHAVDAVLTDADRRARVDEAIRLVRRPGFHGGGRNVSREHDRYLEDAFDS